MAKPKETFVCRECGSMTNKWIGKCVHCGSFNTYEKVEVESPSKFTSINHSFKKAKTVNEIESKNEYRIKTNMIEFDRVYGGGLVNDSVNAIGAVPGAGKTTLLLEVSEKIAEQGYPALYASAEESETQLKKKCERLFGDKVSENLKLLSTKYIENALEEAKRIGAKIIVIDSNKAFATLDESASGSRPGTPSQMMVCTDKVIEFCKNPESPCIGFIVSQYTKDEKMAGPEEFKHAVDSSAHLEFEEGEELRILRSDKNRFGELENGIFMMEEKGLISVDNPNEYFTTKRNKSEEVPGVALTVIKEGTRPLIAEIEALVTHSFTPYPTRIATCLRKDNLNILLSIITEIANVDMNDRNVIINTTGGLKLSSKSSDLAVIMSVLSLAPATKKIIPNDTVFIAEVGLTGELKKVQGIERRINELDRMGYKRVFIAKNNISNKKNYKNIKIIECKNIKDVYKQL